MKNSSEKQSKSNVWLWVGGIVVLFVIIAIISYSKKTTSQTPSSTKNTTNNEFNLSINDTVTITRVRLASAKNALDGTGEFTIDDCNALGLLAKQYKSSADYFSSCTEASVHLMYLSTPDTNNTKVLRLSDDNFTATFVTANDFDKLSNYTFENIKSAGFNKYGGRR